MLSDQYCYNCKHYDSRFTDSEGNGSCRLLKIYVPVEYRCSDWESKNGNGDGCYITTAVCESLGKPDDCYELNAFRNFRDEYLKSQSDGAELIEKYYQTAPEIVSRINADPNSESIYSEIWKKYLSECLSMIESGNNSRCREIYIDMMQELQNRFM